MSAWIVKRHGKQWKAGRVRLAVNGSGRPSVRVDRPVYGSTPEKALRAAIETRGSVKRGTELLLPEPKPREPVPWAPLVALVLVVVSATAGGGVIGYEVGFADAEQLERDVEYYREIAEGCAVAFNDLAWKSSLALYYTLDAQEWLASARAYAEALTRDPEMLLVAEAGQ